MVTAGPINWEKGGRHENIAIYREEIANCENKYSLGKCALCYHKQIRFTTGKLSFVFLKTFAASCAVHLTSAKLIQQGSITVISQL